MTDAKEWRTAVLDTGIYHILPVADLKLHQDSTLCWCKPQIDGNAIIHNSADGRELFEDETEH